MTLDEESQASTKLEDIPKLLHTATMSAFYVTDTVMDSMRLADDQEIFRSNSTIAG